jgi:DNA repair protein RadC
MQSTELAPRLARPLIEETAQAIEHLQDIKGQRKEHFVGLYLNARRELIHKEIVSIGTLNASIVHPRDVFAPAITCNASAVIVAHNHPSGDATPSPEDRDVTHRLKEAGKLLGIPVLEHVIITEYGYSTL